MKTDKVHIAFGFHVNCYHSYRGDTNDSLGFGGDIRIIRHILDVLDDRNRRGIPVKGTWDFENAYSLEKILPEYAPDIISRVKNRCLENGDENILMGYNNGAMSAMTEEELELSVRWAVTNPWGSGLEDIFGRHDGICTHINKPVMRFSSRITYGGKAYFFEAPVSEPLPLAGDGEGVRLKGEIRLPGMLERGQYCFDFFKTEAVDCIFLKSRVQYPYTKEDHEISSQASNLGRFSDPKWTETAPFEITLHTDDSVTVTKRNFAKQLSSYEMADFWKAFPENENIDAINHQLTGGTLCVAGNEGGLLIAHARQILGSMAHCPMRLRSTPEKRIVKINPFGTYFGKQRYYPTRGNGISMELYLAAAPQARSLGPSYNGAFEQSVQVFFGTAGRTPSDAQQAEAESVADGMIVFGEGSVTAYQEDNVRLHDPVGNKVDEKDLKSVTFVEQCGGIGNVLGMVGRYAANLIRHEMKSRR